MYVWIILVGSGILIVLATLVGVADGRARDDAWKKIAARRRANWEERERFTALVDALVQEAGACGCSVCRTRRRMSGRGDGPDDLSR